MKRLNVKSSFEAKVYFTHLTLSFLILCICGISSFLVNLQTQRTIMHEDLELASVELAKTSSIIEGLMDGKISEKSISLIEYVNDDLSLVDHVALLDTSLNCLYHTDKECYITCFPDYISTENMQPRTYDLFSMIHNKTKYLVSISKVFVPDGTSVCGYVAVYVEASKQYTSIIRSLPNFLIAMLLLCFANLFISYGLVKTIRKWSKGYSPEMFTDIYSDQSNILQAMDEGIVAINADGKITYINTLAKQIMKVTRDFPYGTVSMQEAFPESTLTDILKTRRSVYNDHMEIDGMHLLVTHLPLYEDGKFTGAVAIFHPAKFIAEMAEQLECITDMVNTLRIFNHDFMNRLHVILGYLETDHVEEAKKYLLENSMSASVSISHVTRSLHEPSIAALVTGKVLQANEIGIKLVLTPDSFCDEITQGLNSNFYITLLGNLLTNAIEELNSCEREIKEIQLTIYMNAERTYISVLDTGRGILPENLPKLLEFGFSTKGEGRGSGLYILNQMLKEFGSELKIDTEPGEGTEISVLIQTQVLSHTEENTL